MKTEVRDISITLKRTLNIGCGNSKIGTHRVDLYPSKTTTHVLNIDKEKLPFRNNFFDEIIAEQILEHLKNRENFFSECFRVLKKGGVLKIRTDHAGFIFYYIFKDLEHNRLLARWYEQNSFGHNQGDDRHYSLFVVSHIRSLAKDFSRVRIRYFYGGGWKSLLFKLLPYNLGARQIDAEIVK